MTTYPQFFLDQGQISLVPTIFPNVEWCLGKHPMSGEETILWEGLVALVGPQFHEVWEP